jgi:hypothetical protein
MIYRYIGTVLRDFYFINYFSLIIPPPDNSLGFTLKTEQSEKKSIQKCKLLPIGLNLNKHKQPPV